MILTFIEDRVNPTFGEIAARFNCQPENEIKWLVDNKMIFAIHDTDSGYSGETRFVNDVAYF